MSVQYGGNNITFADGSTLGSGWTGFKNRIINGAMMIDQRNAGASVTNTNGSVYPVDRFPCWGSAASKYTAQQSSTAPTGFVKSLLITSSSAYSVGSSDYFAIQQRVEGYNIADLGWGTADAQAVTLTFRVRSSLTGTFGGSLKNSDNTRSYPFTYTISSANTWETKTVTIAGDTSGTWVTTNDIGITISFGLGIGSTYSGTAGAWASANYWSATGATSVVGTNGATFYITGVQLEKGSTATSFDYRPYGTELNLCERYYQILGVYGAVSPTATSSAVYYQTQIRTVMRTTPTATFGNSTFDRMTNYGVLDYYGTYTPSINDYTTNAISYRVNVTSGSSWSSNIPMAVNPTTKSHALLLVTAEL